ncbi:hypothetical protein [Derxia gummosa]|uniref:Uncharacterized protein n=1 Tax=Derxia gummosa DSM 723 TaxID=1121388 RepID=A0A8B6X148_9BURK|nr:hypothetical protein [Derxia gummosa]
MTPYESTDVRAFRSPDLAAFTTAEALTLWQARATLATSMSDKVGTVGLVFDGEEDQAPYALFYAKGVRPGVDLREGAGLMTVQLTAEPGARFVRLGPVEAGGEVQGASDVLAEVLAGL